MAISLFGGNNATLSGRVINETGAPVAGLELSFYYSSPIGGSQTPPTPPIPQTDPPDSITYTNIVTDADGAFSIQVLAGVYQLRTVWSETMGIFPAVRQVTLPENQPITNYVLRVQTTTVEVLGKVTNSAGEPISEVTVRFLPGEFGAGFADGAVSETDALGNYLLRVYPGKWNGQIDSWDLNDRGYLSLAPTNVTFVAPGTNEVNLVVTRGELTISGIVVDQNGEPVKNLELTVGQNAFQAQIHTYFTGRTSDLDGSFSFKVGAGSWYVGAYATLETHQRGYMPLSYPIDVTSDITTNIVIPRMTSLLNGVLLTDDGQPISNIGFQLRSSFNGVDLYRWASTDTNGMFSLPLSNGDWSVVADSYVLGLAGFLPPPGLRLTLNDSTNNLTFVAPTPKVFLQGTIRDDTGAIVTNLAVRIISEGYTNGMFWRTSDTQGNYSVGVVPGKWFFDFDQISLRERHVFSVNQGMAEVLPDSTTTYDLHVIRAPHRIRVTIRDEQGAPVENTAFNPPQPLLLTVSGLIQGQWQWVQNYFVNDTGEVYVPEGDWSINVPTPTNYVPFSSRTLHINTDTNFQFIARKTIVNSALSGQIVDVDDGNKPIPDVTITGYTRTTTRTQTTDVDGKFFFALPPESCALSASILGYLVPAVSVEMRPDTNIFRLIRARKQTSTLRVDFTVPPGHDEEVFSVNARTRIGNDIYYASASDENRIATLSLFPGEWIVSVYPFERSTRFIERRVVKISGAGEQLSINMVSSEATAKIRGKIVDEGGSSLSTAGVTAGTMLGDYKEGVVNPDGTFEVAVFGGEWWLTLWPFQTVGPSINGSLNNLKITDGQELDVGTITFPARTAAPVIQVRAHDDSPIAFDDTFYFYARRTIGPVLYNVSSPSYSPDLSIALMPGEWEFSFSAQPLNNLGFASLQPITLNVPPGLSTNTSVLQPLPSELSVRFTESKDAAGQPRLRLEVDKARLVDIETSADLTNWKLYNDEYMGAGYTDLPTSSSNQVQFYRAIGVE